MLICGNRHRSLPSPVNFVYFLRQACSRLQISALFHEGGQICQLINLAILLLHMLLRHGGCDAIRKTYGYYCAATL